ncbi:MAG: phosphate-starvation-inducible PsiE family protein [Gammaproteobacteria bacterium]|nr:phosphate-starvation-inducible PsiE family protein [Gammaproteobacteria bacterium]MCW8959159.1 phosphate-starvation-inducible PsiE family protein [Gammaproteobacteria bacterium]MCW8973038.1 phosphate-starvation-inducible PsiE family protein [Gammaproteobacteria bacterium]MCW8993001.1 phosphate-starvation-inducible PsiE family protein [Gammaproteobacteria bacterium]
MLSRHPLRTSGLRLGNLIEDAGLMVILLATLVAAGQEITQMVVDRTVRLTDLLLLFIYLEVVAMVHAYWQSGQLPVRMPLYIAVVALARYLILDIKAMDEWRMLAVAGAIVLLTLAVLIIRYGHSRYPYEEKAEDVPKTENDPH